MICIEPNKRVLVKDLVNSVFFPDSDSIHSSQIHHDKNLIIYALLFVPSFLSVKISVEKKRICVDIYFIRNGLLIMVFLILSHEFSITLSQI